MNEYPVGSICQVIDTLDSKAFAGMLNEIVTITAGLQRHNTRPDVMVYEVNDNSIVGINARGACVFTPPHSTLKLIRPPSFDRGLELILGMFPKVEETV